MMHRNRREFLADVGRGMLVASVGSAMAADLGLASLQAADGPARLTFGEREPLVALLQQTPADKLLPLLVEQLKSGTELRTLVACGALANARAFGGHDYDGYHTFMALAPAYHMAQELPAERQALPVLKVLHRNARTIQKTGCHDREHEALHVVEANTTNKPAGPEALQDAVRRCEQAAAEQTLAAMARGRVNDAYDNLQFCIEDDVDVHRVVLAWRAWATLDLTGICIPSAVRSHQWISASERWQKPEC